jgi:DNA repair exonuclease SbcCD ATPase subunit
MSTTTTTDDELIKMVNQLQDHVDELDDRVDTLEEENANLREEIDDLHEEKERLRQQNEQLREWLDDVDDRVDDLEDQPDVDIDGTDYESLTVNEVPIGRIISSKAPRGDLKDEIEDLEARLSGETPTSDAEETPSSEGPEPETPLERIVALPEELVEQELTENQQRARFIAKDIREYSSKAPAGRVIKAATMGRVLKAAFDTAHTETINRVREFLNKLGQDDVDLVDRDNSKIVVFDECLVRRLDQYDTNHGCVMEEAA